jgi:hypothetical protein
MDMVTPPCRIPAVLAVRPYFLFVFMGAPQQMRSHVSTQPQTVSTLTTIPQTLQASFVPSFSALVFVGAALIAFAGAAFAAVAAGAFFATVALAAFGSAAFFAAVFTGVGFFGAVFSGATFFEAVFVAIHKPPVNVIGLIVVSIL